MDAVRTTNRIVSALLALALTVGGVVVAIEVVLAALDREPWLLPHDGWYRSMRETSWEDRSARLAFLALAAAGLALVLLEVARRRAPALPMAPRSDGARTDLDRRGLERWLATRLSDVEGATAVKAKIGTRSVDVAAQTPQRDVADVQQRLERAAQDHLNALDLAAPLAARAKVTSRRQG
jgi:hypothetical protein